jgi:hypothetical protein
VSQTNLERRTFDSRGRSIDRTGSGNERLADLSDGVADHVPIKNRDGVLGARADRGAAVVMLWSRRYFLDLELRSSHLLVDGFDVDLDEDLLADEEAAGLERLVPRDAELVAVDSRRGVEAGSGSKPTSPTRCGNPT